MEEKEEEEEDDDDDDDNVEENDDDHADACSQPPRTPLRHVSFIPSSPPPAVCRPSRCPARPSFFLTDSRCTIHPPFSDTFGALPVFLSRRASFSAEAIPPLHPLLLPAGWRSTEVGGREEAKLGGGGRHFMEVKRTRRRRKRWWRRSHGDVGRGSLSRTGGEREATRHGWSGVMEAGVDIVWHYRTNFPWRTLRYWFRRAQPKQPE